MKNKEILKDEELEKISGASSYDTIIVYEEGHYYQAKNGDNNYIYIKNIHFGGSQVYIDADLCTKNRDGEYVVLLNYKNVRQSEFVGRYNKSAQYAD